MAGRGKGISSFSVLLLFVFVTARSWRYMLVIAITLAVNLLISVALYYFLGLQIHIYTLAGVTVSLGIIFDNSIVMIDHYVRCGDRKVFPSLLCAVHFNSLRLPLAIILMIPLSFVGLFLAFGLSDFTFDKGGFAAFVMLCGITVNAGIYLVSEWLSCRSGRWPVAVGHDPSCHPDFSCHPRLDRGSPRPWLRAFSRKIQPVSLTILSTVLGLVPFFFDGPSEVFWFAFAVGTVAGLLFSVLALLLYLPVFALRRK